MDSFKNLKDCFIIITFINTSNTVTKKIFIYCLSIFRVYVWDSHSSELITIFIFFFSLLKICFFYASDMGASIWCQLDACLSVWFYYISFNDWITINSATNDSIMSARFNIVTLNDRLALNIVQGVEGNYSILVTFLNPVFENQRLIIFYFKSDIIYLHIIKRGKSINLCV